MKLTSPARTGSSALPDGRRLAWCEWGPVDGPPVLLCSGAATSARLGLDASAVDALGVRLIAIDRPGLGRSSPHPERTLTSWADDVRSLVAERASSPPRVVGVSQGAPFALALHGLARSIAIVSASDELAHPAVLPSLVPDVRALVERVSLAPEEAEAFFRTMDAARFHAMVIAMSSEADRRVYLEPVFDAALRGAIDEAFTQGSAGYARDTVLAMSRWPFACEAIRVPVAVWYGAADTSPVHSPDLGATLARRLASAERRVVAEAGGALAWTHTRMILEALVR